jgi:hypothetical protein
MTSDELAQEIRRVDGENSLGAGALAEALLPFLTRTPAPEGEAVAWRVKYRADGWILFHHEAPARASGEARNGALVQPLYASPVVPVGSGEGERKLVGQDYINAIKAHRVEHGSSLAVARNAVDCGWRPPAPVVPVGVGEVLDAAAAYLKDQYGASHGLDHPVDRARIIAALRHTDTGRE